MIYFNDFERTEDSDSIQAIIGRSLIVSTRFENLCKHTHKMIITGEKQIKWRIDRLVSDDHYEIDNVYIKFFDDAFEKFVSLLKSIECINEQNLPEGCFVVLKNAKNARNELVHSSTIGMEGCIEKKISENIEIFLLKIKKLINIIAEGDCLISNLITQMNKEDVLTPSGIQSYKANIINWVMDR